MTRWLVQLAGERLDLEEFPLWFPDGDVHAIEEDGAVFLAGTAFEALPDAEAVLEAANRALDDFAAVIWLIWPSLKKPVVTHVWRETAEGKRKAFIFLTGSIEARSKARAVGIGIGGPALSPRHTQAQELLQRVSERPHLHTALSLVTDPLTSWPRLYRALEEIEQHLGQRVDAAGQCLDQQRQRFTRTANTAEVSGADARHAAGRFDPPPDPMTLREATQFVREMLTKALRGHRD